MRGEAYGLSARRLPLAGELFRASRLVDARLRAFLNDLLPLPYNEETLAVVAAMISNPQPSTTSSKKKASAR
jgi:hypothetical protein